MKTLKFARTAAAALALCAGFAQASPIVTDWTVTDFATFVPGSVLPGGNTYPLPVLSTGNTQLHWGAATPQSGLIIGNSGVHVIETLNEPGARVICADGGPNHVGLNINGCADICVISATSLNFPFPYDSDGATN